MEILKRICLAIAIIVLVVVAVAYFLPAAWTADERITIRAKKEQIYEQIANLRNWPNWAIWYQGVDKNINLRYEGPKSGIGAHSFWEGEKIGKGDLLITKADPSHGIEYDLHFDDGDMKTKGKIGLADRDGSVEVHWRDGGDLGLNPFKRYLGFYIGYLVSKDFQNSLENLKNLLENRRDNR